MLQKLLDFYEKYENLGLKVTFIIFSLQIIHLYWLTTTVVLPMATGINYFPEAEGFELLFAVIDYIEVPALISGIVFYLVYMTRDKRNAIFLTLLILQAIHVFWITDEVVVDQFYNDVIIFPIYVAWFAILIDYLEIPVMIDMFRKIRK